MLPALSDDDYFDAFKAKESGTNKRYNNALSFSF